MPDVHIATPDVRVESPITVNPPAVHFDPEAIKIVLELPEQRQHPVIDVAYQKPRRKRFELPSGDTGTVIDGDGEVRVEFDDGRTATVKETEDE